MMPGDMIVCGVRGFVVLDDIQVTVPQGHAVLIPADKAVRSTDVHRELSSGALFRLSNNNLLYPPKPQVEEPAAKPVEEGPTVLQLSATIQQLQEQNAVLLRTQQTLQTQVETLTKQLTTAQSDTRLDDILSLLKTRPVVVESRSTVGAREKVETEEVPTYIPSQIKPTDIEASHIVVQETSQKGNVSTAGNALRKLRAGQ